MPFGASLNEAFQTPTVEYGTPAPNNLAGGGLNSGWKTWGGPKLVPSIKNDQRGGGGLSNGGLSGGCSACSKPAPHYLVNGPGRFAYSQSGGGLLGGGLSGLGSGGVGKFFSSLAGGANGDGVESSTADIRNTVGPPFSGNIDVTGDTPDLATNLEIDDFDADRNQFLVNVDKVDLPRNEKVTPDIQRTAMPKDVEPACTDAKCVEILNHLMRCNGCRKRLNDLLNINRNTFLGIDFSKIDYQKVLFYIIIAIVVIAFYELFNMLLGRGAGRRSVTGSSY